MNNYINFPNIGQKTVTKTVTYLYPNNYIGSPQIDGGSRGEEGRGRKNALPYICSGSTGGYGLVLEGKSKFKKYSYKVNIHIPAKMHQDSAFPFKEGDTLLLKVAGDRLIITKNKRGKQ